MSLQSRGPRDSLQWIAVYITHNLQEAHIIKGKLAASDIPAMIHKEAGAAAIGLTLGNLGEIKILVSPSDFDQAEALLFSDSADQIEANNDNIQLIWDDDPQPPNADADNDE